MAVYTGTRQQGGMGHQEVLKDGVPLSPEPSQKLHNHSSGGFNWGYTGSGPAQLALALLLDATGDKALALAHYQDFKWRFVATWREEWQIATEEIKRWLGLQPVEVGS